MSGRGGSILLRARPPLPQFDYETIDHHFGGMCGRIIQATSPMNLAIIDGLDVALARLVVGTFADRPFMPVLAWRILDEELFLRRNSPGYEEYADKLQYRLIPHLWYGMPSHPFSAATLKPSDARPNDYARDPNVTPSFDAC